MSRLLLTLYKILLIGSILTLIVVIGASSHKISLKNRENIFLIFSIIVYIMNLILLYLIEKVKIRLLMSIFHYLALGIFIYLFGYFITRPELANQLIFIVILSGILLNIYSIIAFRIYPVVHKNLKK